MRPLQGDGMTAIAGVKYRGDVWLGGDSAAVAGNDLLLETSPKVFRVEDVGFGYTWSFRYGQTLEHGLADHLDWPAPKRGVRQWVIRTLVPAMVETFKAAEWLKTENGRVEGGQALVAVRGRLFRINSDFSVIEPQDRFGACGGGGELVLGALSQLPLDMHPRYRILRALGAAERFNVNVRRPFRVLQIARH